MKHKIFVTICVEVETHLDIPEALDEFSSNTEYSFSSTENVTVLNTDFRESYIEDNGIKFY